ncbi:MAG TPA: glycine/sarcosine/betaine reductase component B subunit, partial [Candidatus Binatia bacterium]|nr:glycine/sarcosine/betaine reductase component B subunit [Candidatus Binatia bacterium]
MRLELARTHLKYVRFGPRTEIRSSMLTIDRDRLVQLLEHEPLFERVDVELAHPDESCRIIHVLDVYEPRYKPNGANFPGALDDFALVGDGQTRALKNVSVVVSAPASDRARSLIDMRGPAAELSPFGKLHNVIVMPLPKKDADADEYRLAAKKAGLRTAAYLAAAAEGLAPDETQIYDLPPLALNPGPEGLPRIAYIFPIHSHQHPTHHKETVFYGSNIQGFMPTIVHPNEILDGALVFSYS